MDPRHIPRLLCLCLPLAASLLAAQAADAQGLRARFERLREASRQERPVALPAGAMAIRNVAYGADPAQRFDIYLPANPRNAPVVFYVHGGGWANGDKTNPGTANKLAYWLPKGYAVVSANYRMLPAAMPLEQARDVARAVATAQSHATEWKIDAKRFVLMGHSAGAHLVALLGADPRMLAEAGAQRPRGVVSLDSGALDVPALMSQPRVPRLYRNAFGTDEKYWIATSPQHRLSRDALPMLIVCSSERRFPTSPCEEGRKFARRGASLGVAMRVLPEPLDHGAINHDLGTPSAYTDDVGAYIDGLVR
ncbi:alpha/beta hydrolase [Pseudoxanthomonas helianthi]|uniref:Alpha/beta hydrolase n=1 Tax=Pseudoxanthomonas helianthi TaxID=1453541 RepID=A0A940X3C1_9GAMM|nr:alpha/beta hydrolase [Pseudoxanthomonas helianthi]MBP3983944.1 alpha/beta hydrolase [Pseudoxanthomonas helianthi]